MKTQIPNTKNIEPMRLGIATDHGGFELKEKLAVELRGAGGTPAFTRKILA
jgi:hypothetical protein